MTARAAVPAVALAGMLLAVAGLRFADPDAPIWPAALVLVLAVVTLRAPDGPRALLTLAAYALAWLAADPSETTVWAWVAGAGLLAFHAAIAYAATAPAGFPHDPESVRRWLRDAGVVLAATLALWLVVVGFHERTTAPELLVGSTLLLLAGLVWLLRRPEH